MFKDKIRNILLICIIVVGLTGCGGKTTNKNTVNGESDKKHQVTYYEEYNKLPELKNVTKYESESSSKTLTGSDAGEVTITYIVNDDDNSKEIVKKYLKYIEDYGFSNKSTTEKNSYSIIYEGYIVSNISYKNNEIELVIIPKKNQLSSKIVELKPDETIKTDDYEFTLTKVEFSYDVKPSDTSGSYMSYQADSGKVYINAVVKIKNLMERNIRIDELYKISAVYSDKYNYEGFVVVDVGNNFDWSSSYSAASPLETAKTHGLIDCPKEVASSANALYVDFVLADGVTYRYTIR